MNREGLRDALSHPNVAAFLAVIDLGEHGPHADDPDRYRTIYGGEKFDGLEHPRKAVTAGGWTSTAAGRGQFLAKTWDGLVRQYGFPDFSPACQDEAMVALIAGRGSLQDVIAGRFEQAIAKCAKEWASLPGSPYGQPTLTMEKARARYLERGGYLSAAPVEAVDKSPDLQGIPVDKSPEMQGSAPSDPLATEHYGEAVTESVINPVPSADEQEARMSPFIIPALEIAAKYLPSLAEHFSSGSKSAVRNIAAGKVIADAITEATGSPNIQAAVEKLEARDAQATAAAKSAVADVLPMLVEAGGGGIKGARDANDAQSGDWRKLVFSLPFVGIVLFTPAIWAVVAASVFKASWLLEMDPQLRGTVIGFVMGTLAGSICGYVFGSSMTKAPAQPFTAR